MKQLPNPKSQPVRISRGPLEEARRGTGRKALFVLALASFMLAASIDQVWASDFVVARANPVGSFPQAVVIADLNGDGHPDLVTANYTDFTLTVLLGNGDGTFQPPATIFLGPNYYPNAIAVGDVNHDGKADMLVTGSGSGQLTVLLGNGDGTFIVRPAIPVGSGPTSVAIGDLNGDGNPDAVVTNFTGGTVQVLIGDGTGAFSKPAPFSAGADPASVSIQDLNNDGHADLVVANYLSNTISIFLGAGDGTFGAPRTMPTGIAPYSVAAADFNGDGRVDVAVACTSSDAVFVFLGNGDGTLQPGVPYGTGSQPYAVRVGDLDGDGQPDLVTANFGGNDLSVLHGNGDGTFGGAQGFGAGSNPISVAVGDLNGDGRADLAAANYSGSDVSVLLGSGTSGFLSSRDFTAGLQPTAVAAGDFDGNGVMDLAVANSSSNSVSVFLAVGPGIYQPAVNYPVGTSPTAVIAIDLNGDGIPDLVAANRTSSTLSVLLGNGDGTFRTAVSYPTGSGPLALAAGRLNADTAPDLVVGCSDGSISVLLGHGDGTFSPAVSYSRGAAHAAVAVADMNGDGILDVVVAPFEGADLAVIPGLGDGTLDLASALSVSTGSSAVALSVGDFDKDHRLDVAVAGNSSDLRVFLGDGTGHLSPVSPSYTVPEPASVAAADVDGDGSLDLLVSSSSTNSLAVLKGAGDGTFEAPVDYPTGRLPQGIAVVDLNGDGSPDVAVANSESGSLRVFLNAHSRLASLLPAGLSFGQQLVGTTSDPQGVTLTAVGTGPVAIDKIVASGGYLEADDCPNVLASGASCTVDVSFSPAAQGSVPGTLTVVDGALGSPQTATLSGVGFVPVYADLSVTKTGPSVVSFAEPIVYTIVVANAGPSPALGSSVVDTLPGDLSGATWTCAGAAGGACPANGTGSIATTIDLPPGASVVFTLTASLSASASGQVANTATAIPPTGVTDPSPTNNSATTVASVVVPSITLVGPHGAEEWPVGSTQSITWTHNLGASATFNLDLSRDSGATWEALAHGVSGGPTSGSYAWGVAGPVTALARVRVAIPDGSVSDASGSDFTIARAFNPADTLVISTIAGTGVGGYGGDGGPGPSALLSVPYGVALDPKGNIFIADYNNSRIRRVDGATGIITTYAGTGVSGFSGDGGPATEAQLNNAVGVATDRFGNLFIADHLNGVIRRVDASTGIISTLPGAFSYPEGVAVDHSGNVFVADRNDCVIARIDSLTNAVTTYAGTGDCDFAGDGGPATDASLSYPTGVALDAKGNLYIADYLNSRIRRVDALTLSISTVAGNGSSGYNGDGIPATTAALYFPLGVVVDADGSVIIADWANSRIRRVDALTGLISSISGTGACDFGGDGGPAADGVLCGDSSVALGLDGKLYATDNGNNRVRRVSPVDADLSVGVDDGQDVVQPGGSSTYTVTVTNLGPSVTAGASLSVTLPTAATGASWTCAGTGGASCSPSGVGAPNDAVTLPVGGTATYTVLVTVSPSASGTFAVSTAATASPVVTDPTSNNVATDIDSVAYPVVSLSTTSLSFGSEPLGSSSPSQGVTLGNTGAAPLLIGSILVSGDFSETNNCPASLAAGASCTISVAFAPTSPGPRSGLLTISDNAPGTPQGVGLSGTGVDTTPPSVVLLSPTGGERVFIGTPYVIQWNASDNVGLASFDVAYSTDGGSTFSPVPGCTGLPGSSLSCTWATPGPATTQGRIRVTARDTSANAASATSAANFSIVTGTPTVTLTAPTTAVTWRIANSQNITFKHTLGVGQKVVIDVSRDSGSTWTTINPAFVTTSATTGTFAWTVSGPPTAGARVRVSWAGNPAINSAGTVDFVIEDRITIKSPITAVTWAIGSSHNITWSHNLGTSESVNIDLSLDGGLSWTPVAAGVPNTTATTGTYAWVVAGPASTTALVRVSWAADPSVTSISPVNFTISGTISTTSPTGSSSWGIGSHRTITWNHNLGPGQLFNILLSTDAGATFPTTIASGVGAQSGSGSYDWVVAGPASTTARVRVQWAASTGVAGTTGSFTMASPVIAVTAPNTAVNWAIGTTRSITWTQNLGTGESVNIDLSTDGGATWGSVASNIPNSANASGTFSWLVAGPASTSARIRVSWASDGTVLGESAVNFTLAPPFVTVTAPNTNVAWAIGSTKNITFTQNLGIGQIVNIDLSRDGGVTWSPITVFTLTSDTSGTFGWVVTGPATTQARVRVSWSADSGVTDTSNVNFRIQ